MRTCERECLENNAVARPLAETNASDRAVALHRVARMSAEEIVAQHEPTLTGRRFRAMLAAAEAPSAEARVVADTYAAKPGLGGRHRRRRHLHAASHVSTR